MKGGLTVNADLSAIAIATGPGLAVSRVQRDAACLQVTYHSQLCLQQGLKFAQELSSQHNLPLIAVNHLEAHILVSRLTDSRVSFPFTALLVSGGHTQLLHARGVGQSLLAFCLLFSPRPVMYRALR